jgi:predicted nucleic acid-binding protein
VILVDSSAWIEFDRRTGTATDRLLRRLIENDAELAVTQPVVMEVLAGARTPVDERDLRRMLETFPLLPFDANVDFDAAARIYRACRRSGITPRGMIDCMIAAVASRTEASLLSADGDVKRIAGVMGIELAR